MTGIDALEACYVAFVKVAAFDASVRLVACVVADSVSPNRYQRVAVAAEPANDADSVATAGLDDVAATASIRLVGYVAVPGPSSQVRRLVSSYTGCPSWNIACTACLPHISNAVQHTPRRPARHGYAG